MFWKHLFTIEYWLLKKQEILILKSMTHWRGSESVTWNNICPKMVKLIPLLVKKAHSKSLTKSKTVILYMYRANSLCKNIELFLAKKGRRKKVCVKSEIVILLPFSGLGFIQETRKSWCTYFFWKKQRTNGQMGVNP